ncbi:MAG: hypothetical protein ACT4TC_01920 [Myxococcaceae bacterium]
MIAALLATAAFLVDDALPSRLDVERTAHEHWRKLEQTYLDSAGAPAREIRIQLNERLPPGQGGASQPGRIELRSPAALRHELAHQFLWAHCPAAAQDRLFHEAWALATSGELNAWDDGGYQSVTAAAALLERGASLDRNEGRKALARLVSENPERVRGRLAHCNSGAQWPPLTLSELTSSLAAVDAWVVLSRHSGEVLAQSGDVRTPLPFGSALKPFVFASLSAPPLRKPELTRSEWQCGQSDPMDARTALLRSCNGYFLDLPRGRLFGGFTQALLSLGLSRAPRDMAEAIGLRAELTLAPLALASAYQLLARARPDVVELLQRNAEQGTLSELPQSGALRGVATKTGTVRDAQQRPVLGWIVAVTDDVVAVMARKGKAPRAFVDELVTSLPSLRANTAAQVRTFGLLPAASVEASCGGTGFSVSERGATAIVDGVAPLKQLLREGEVVCIGGPWWIRFPGLKTPREYAGTFVAVPPGRERKESAFLFRTTLARYAAGVLRSEDAAITGEARIALATVVAHNAHHSPHPAHVPCDTTHCQVFQGTIAARAEELRALKQPPLDSRDWLPFSRGGKEAWTERRAVDEVTRLLGASPTALRFQGLKAQFVRREGSAEGPYDVAVNLPCEALRNPLKLPSCPDQGRREGDSYFFSGRGRGHGEGLSLEQAKRSGLSHQALLRQAYPRAR